MTVDVHDAFANHEEASHEYGIELMENLEDASGYDCVVGAVSHDAYAAFGEKEFMKLAKPGGLIADIKGMWRKTSLPDGLRRWSL